MRLWQALANEYCQMQGNATFERASTILRSAASIEVCHCLYPVYFLKRLTRDCLDRYIQLLKENREKGYRGQQQNYVPGVTGPAGGPEIATNYPTVQQAFGSRGSDFRKGNTAGTGKGGADRY